MPFGAGGILGVTRRAAGATVQGLGPGARRVGMTCTASELGVPCGWASAIAKGTHLSSSIRARVEVRPPGDCSGFCPPRRRHALRLVTPPLFRRARTRRTPRMRRMSQRSSGRRRVVSSISEVYTCTPPRPDHRTARRTDDPLHEPRAQSHPHAHLAKAGSQHLARAVTANDHHHKCVER